MQRPNRRPQTSLQNFTKIGYAEEDLQTKAWMDEYPPVKQSPIEGFSEYDESKWPKKSSEFGPGLAFKDKCPKGEISEKFCLNTEDDIVDLYYFVKQTEVRQRIVHLYLCWELERRAWEKYGGPTGLQAARNRLHGKPLDYVPSKKIVYDEDDFYYGSYEHMNYYGDVDYYGEEEYYDEEGGYDEEGSEDEEGGYDDDELDEEEERYEEDDRDNEQSEKSGERDAGEAREVEEEGVKQVKDGEDGEGRQFKQEEEEEVKKVKEEVDTEEKQVKQEKEVKQVKEDVDGEQEQEKQVKEEEEVEVKPVKEEEDEEAKLEPDADAQEELVQTRIDTMQRWYLDFTPAQQAAFLKRIKVEPAAGQLVSPSTPGPKKSEAPETNAMDFLPSPPPSGIKRPRSPEAERAERMAASPSPTAHELRYKRRRVADDSTEQ